MPEQPQFKQVSIEHPFAGPRWFTEANVKAYVRLNFAFDCDLLGLSKRHAAQRFRRWKERWTAAGCPMQNHA